MRKWLSVLIPVPLLAVLGGCGFGRSESFSHHSDAICADIGELQRHVSEHRAAMAAARDMNDVSVAEEDYAARGPACLARLDGDLDTMACCPMCAGDPPDARPLRAHTGAAGREIQTHQALVAASGSVEEARREEARHQAAMNGHLAHMREHHREMTEWGGMHSGGMMGSGGRMMAAPQDTCAPEMDAGGAGTNR
jgi:general stress protein YciG